jgi:tryptophan 2,3-dioxygenase
MMAVENERGVIAETYEKLQGLHILKEAREKHPLPKASAQSTLRAIFQAVEITLLNLTDLISRASKDIEEGGTIGSAVVKMSWTRGFHQVMVRLSMLPQQLGFGYENPPTVIRISESPVIREYEFALKHFDEVIVENFRKIGLQIDSVLSNQSLDSPEFNLIHLARICNHETTIWEHNLSEICVPEVNSSYDKFVGSEYVRKAVYNNVLRGDTYFVQFRGLHQISEVLGEEINDHLEEVIRDIRGKHLSQAIEHMSCINILAEGILSTMPPMIDNLATSDYHAIRENLGQTSGSHSISLHYHLFKDLYEQLWEVLMCQILVDTDKEYTEESIEKAIRKVDHGRFYDTQNWMMHFLLNECLKLRTFIFQWRESHLHLPRNELGGYFTRSLTGSPDAIKKVKQMRDSAHDKDPMKFLASARGLSSKQNKNKKRLTKYLEAKESLDSQILLKTGEVTKLRFKNVQDQSDFFKNQCPFSVPPRRQV